METEMVPVQDQSRKQENPLMTSDAHALDDPASASPVQSQRRSRGKSTSGGLTGPEWNGLKCHEKVYLTMFDQNSGPAAKAFTLVMSIIVIVSITFFCMGTMPAYSTPERVITFDTADDIFNIVFTIEFLVRVSVILPRAAPQKELCEVFMIVDLLAILPAIIGWCSGRVPFSTEPQAVREAGAAAMFLLLKSLKSLRLLKLLRFFNETVILSKALKKSGPALMVPAFAIIVTATVFGSFVFVLESIGALADPDGPDAAFESIPHTMWFMFVTMTTIGYGDVSPTTHLGKAFTVPVMVFGVLLISMPLAVVGNNFTEVWAEKDKVIFVEKLRELIASQGLQANAVQVAFKELDTDNSGTISFKEFKAAIYKLQIQMPARDVLKLWRSIDVDGSGEILVNELVELIAEEGVMETEPEVNYVFRLPTQAQPSEAYMSVHVDDEGKVHYKPADELRDLPEGASVSFEVSWLKDDNVTEEMPKAGVYTVFDVDEDTVVLPQLPDGSCFSFENLRFVFSHAADERVYLSNVDGHVDNVNTDPVGYPVTWKDRDGSNNFPKVHPVGFEVVSIDEKDIVTCKVESSGVLFTFENPIRDPSILIPSENVTVKELEGHMNARFDKIESGMKEMKALLAQIASKL